ncbi:MAG: YdcF family protein [Nocardiopsaceae bacterium]|nr:YdcF family protein [Nocardiopsaceae bacterium]
MRTQPNAQAHSLAQRLWDFHTAPAAPAAPRHSDLILALGSHDLRVAAHAGRLWAQGAAPVIVFSGDRGRRTSGDGGHERWPRPEAEEFAQTAARTAGVPASAMLLETRSTNTGENFTFSRALCREHSIAVGPAVVTAKPYMARRALATAAVRWPDARWSFRCFASSYADYPRDRSQAAELIHFLVGDLQRLHVYARRGWSAPVEIPDEVWEAYHRLVALGFTAHLVAGEPARP